MTDLYESLKLADYAWCAPTLTRKRTQVYVAENYYDRWVCFDATDSLDDLLDHAQAWPVAFKGQRVHKGWLGAYLAVKNDLESLPKKKTVFCGHSLGGTLAQIATLDLGGRFVSTGAPRPWYDKAPELDGVRYETEWDWITKLYPWLHHAGETVKLRVGSNIFNAHYPMTYKRAL